MSIESKFLGKKTEYKSEYDPTLLVPVPRQENRNLINIKNEELPFCGYDVWNAYECSALTTNGLPFCGVAKIVYPAQSEFLVESKSLKLYLNSFNMTQLGNTIEETQKIMEHTISNDLSKALKTAVRVHMRKAYDNQIPYHNFPHHYEQIDCAISKDLQCSVYNEDHTLLQITDIRPSAAQQIEGLMPTELTSCVSHSLRSNCKITHQPDWGTVYIKFISPKTILYDDLYKYIVSFRNESHFHEEICETIYKRLFDILKPESLLVGCFYTRRGGIDINPIRARTYKDLEEFEDYINEKNVSYKHTRQ